MRSTYLDEAGISNPQQEPVIVVAGVILQPDTQWLPLHRHFEKLVERFVPEDRRDGFVFHAMEIFHGTKVFDRATYKGDRKEVLTALCQTLHEFQLPVVFGISRRAEIEDAVKDDQPESNNSRSITRIGFMKAFAESAAKADQWMNHYAHADECLSLIVENNDQLKRYAKGMFKEIKKKIPHPEFAKLFNLPLTRIIDAPAFMDKADAPPLQLADLCCFMIKRWLMEKPDVQDYIRIIMPSMLAVLTPEQMKEFRASAQRLLEKAEAQQSGAEVRADDAESTPSSGKSSGKTGERRGT